MQASQHVIGTDVFFVAVLETLVTRDVADRTERRSADLARSLRNFVGHGEDLAGLLVEEQMIVAKVPAAHVPVEILRLQVKCENVRQQRAQDTGYFNNRSAQR